MKLDNLGEEMRVLYVAMTRAREKLFMTALVNDIDKWRENWEQEIAFSDRSANKIPFSVLASAGSFLDFVAPCMKEVQWIYPEDLLGQEIKESVIKAEQKRKLLLTEADKNVATELSKKVKRSYPHEYLSELFVKTTVSELKKAAYIKEEPDAFSENLFEEPEIIPYIPSFIKEKEGMSGTDRGSAYHKVMELLDFAVFHTLLENAGEQKAIDGEYDKPVYRELFCQLEKMVENEILSKEWREAVSVKKIATFLESSLARRMAEAAVSQKLYKEQPFVLGLNANRVKENFSEDEMVLMQGIIDVYFEEEGQIVVADYKTDRVGSPEELVNRYYLQLDYYAEALERLTGKNVKEKIIYSFALNEEIRLP